MNPPYAARFKLYVMCTNCLRKSAKVLCVTQEDEAPTSIDELVDSALLKQVTFDCRGCESVIAEIVGIDELPLHDEDDGEGEISERLAA